jgi:hypothetical protein
MSNYYIVFAYRNYSSFPTKLLMGIYEDEDSAYKRQKDICGSESYTDFNSSMNGNGLTVFINVFPKGDCSVELFTTKL